MPDYVYRHTRNTADYKGVISASLPDAVTAVNVVGEETTVITVAATSKDDLDEYMSQHGYEYQDPYERDTSIHTLEFSSALTGVLDSNFPVFGDFTEIASGETGNYTTTESLRNHHIYILVNSITTGGSIIITGTSIDDESMVPTSSDTETITVDTSTAQYYQSLKKWIEVTNISVAGTTGINYDWGSLGYYSYTNRDFKLFQYRADIRATGGTSRFRISIYKIGNGGGNKVSIVPLELMSYVSTNPNGTYVDGLRTGSDDRSYTMSTNLISNNGMLTFKMSDFDTYFTNNEHFVDGSNDEGIILQLENINAVDFAIILMTVGL